MHKLPTVDDAASPASLISFLPEKIWYLTSNGRDMWCRRPYTFFFSSDQAAASFAQQMEVQGELSPIAVQARELVSPDALSAMRQLRVTRIFLDPSIDPESGDVYGRILRLQEAN